MRHALPPWATLALGILLQGTVGAIDVTFTSDRGAAFPVNTPVMFTAVATNVNPVTTYTWYFGDNGEPTTTTTPSVKHVFSAANDQLGISVTVKNGVDANGYATGFYEAYVPPPLTAPMGVNSGDSPEISFDAGMTLAFSKLQAGFINGELSLDVAHQGISDSYETEFGDGASIRMGGKLVHRYARSGIFILKSQHTQGGSEVGILRKTLVFSECDIYGSNSDPNVIEPAIQDRRLTFKLANGRFNFGATANSSGSSRRGGKSIVDTLSMNWAMTLPAGFDTQAQHIQLSIGNVGAVDAHGNPISIPLKANGTAMLTQPSPFKSIKIKYPTLPKGQTRTTQPFTTTVNVVMSAPGLVAQGFDSESISPIESKRLSSNGPFYRTLQVAVVFAGVSYSGIAPVSLTIAPKGGVGMVTGQFQNNSLKPSPEVRR